VIRLQTIGLKYPRGTEVLRDVTFHLRPGSFHFLTGPSGSGKTSLLRLLFMSMPPTRGQIFILGQDISRIAPAKRAQLRRRIGIVFQDFRLLDHMTTWENVAMPLRVTGKRISDYKEDVTDLLQWVGLAGPVTSAIEIPHDALKRLTRVLLFSAATPPPIRSFPVGATLLVGQRVVVIACSGTARQCEDVKFNAKISAGGGGSFSVTDEGNSPQYDEVLGAPVIDDRGIAVGVIVSGGTKSPLGPGLTFSMVGLANTLSMPRRTVNLPAEAAASHR